MKNKAYSSGILIALAVLCWTVVAYGQDRSGVITGGAIPARGTFATKLPMRVDDSDVALKKYREAIADRERQWTRERWAMQLKSTSPASIADPPRRVILPKRIDIEQQRIDLQPQIELQRLIDPPKRVERPTVPPIIQLPVSPKLMLGERIIQIDHQANQPALESVPIQITLTGPTSPVNPNNEIVLTVGGLSYDELLQATKTSEPRATLSPGQIGGRTILGFLPVSIGPHTVTVSVELPRPEWLGDVDRGLAGATAGADVDAALIAEFKSLSNRLAKAATTRSSSCVVQVGQVSPVPPPRPIPPQPEPPRPTPTPRPIPPVADVLAIIIRQPNTITVGHAEVLSDLRQWGDQPGNIVEILEVAPDGIDPNGILHSAIPGYVRRIPAGKTLPYVFVVRTVIGGGGSVIWHDQLPDNAEAIIVKLQQPRVNK